MVQFGLEHVDHQRVGVEGVTELVHQDRQPPDLLGQPLGHLVLHVLDNGADLVLHLVRHHLQLTLSEVQSVQKLLHIVPLLDPPVGGVLQHLPNHVALPDHDVSAPGAVARELGPHSGGAEAVLQPLLELLVL